MSETIPTPPSETILTAGNLGKTFRDFWRRPKVQALRGLHLELFRGEVFGLLGPNGSGKSTAMKLLLGLLHPSAGEITIFGSHNRDPRVRERIGYLPELTCLHRGLTPDELLDYYAALSNLKNDVRKTRIEQLLTMLDLKAWRHRPIGEFSKGMSRRVGLAQALINNPDLIVLDEPTSGLDPIGCRQIKNLLRSLADQGRTVLMSSHLLADVEDICDRVAILRQGETLAIGAVEALLTQPDGFCLKIQAENERDALEKQRRIGEHFQVKVEIIRPSIGLEQYFLEIIRRKNGTAEEDDRLSSLTMAPFLATPENIKETALETDKR